MSEIMTPDEVIQLLRLDSGTGDPQEKLRNLNVPRRETAFDEASGGCKTPANWERFKEVTRKLMLAAFLRPSYIARVMGVVDTFQRTFPDTGGPADITPAMAEAYKAGRLELGRSSSCVRADMRILAAAFGRWLGHCGTIGINPFANVATETPRPRVCRGRNDRGGVERPGGGQD